MKHLTFAPILWLWSFCALLMAQNLVTNGDFEQGMTGWGTWFVDKNATWADPPRADAVFAVKSPGLGGSNQALYVTVKEPGKSDWYILVAKSVPFKKGEMYQLRLRATSTLKRTISVAFHTDITSGGPFAVTTISISAEDKIYGPFSVLYEPTPVNPGIKIQFGGMSGDVIIDDVVIEQVKPQPDEYHPYNSLEDIIGDITLPHEGLPHGVPLSVDWSQRPRRGAQRPPEGWTAAIAWGQLYEWAEGNPATNTRVQIRDMEMYYLSKSDNRWHLLQKALRVSGAAYVEDFHGDLNKPADIRTEPDGSISVTAGDGYNFHFWPSTGRVTIPKDDIEGCFVTVQARLILADPNGVDDRDDARYLLSVGGDWWQSLTAVWDNWKTNADMGIGRFRFVRKEWRGHNMITLSADQVRQNPPPIAGSTAVFDLTDRGHLPQVCRLEQNYPNPFNATTTISYSLAESGFVELAVYNITGKCIAILVNEPQQAGEYIVLWNAGDLPGGLYFCRLNANGLSQVKKMVVQK
ncbi:MAG: T9SS type A sorting domain-containing protein [candidate division KSB1 bacterium]|nr:T9SS type A sorting domain-containing protein [candidate division KSB1 bacterium]MDZ7345306.1 T9SS type A sorting domain-containing protein [candidate division KSB1 bacterium]